MWELDSKESWAPKNWCFWTVVLEKTPVSKRIKTVNLKGNQPWILIGRIDAEAETPILWPPDAKDWLTGKDPDAGKEKVGGEGDDRGWDGWMASLTRWTWVWVGSRSWWWTRRPGVLQFMGTQRIRHDWITELNWLSMYYVNEYFSLKCIHCNSKRSLHTFTPEVRQPGNCLFISSLHWKLSKNNDVA